AKYPSKRSLEKHNRDDALFANLRSKQGVTVLEGKYKFNPENPQEPPTEKGVDVLLATEFLADGIMNNFDVAYIVSNDSDIIPAVQKLKTISKSLKVFQVTFSPREEWQQACEVYQLYKYQMKKFKAHMQPTDATMSDLAKKFNKK
ncbi:MAG: NYN domain-containing protein, partial [Bdellovibrionales bacterium]|nr:NYN domain-containing protein [Bdellovibrionales bacterium]